MLVKERMTPNPITVKVDTSMFDALHLMRERKVRRLPVLDKAGKLVGMVSEKDLLYASPSPATTLSVFEVNSLIAKIKVGQLMSKELITIDGDCPLEEAARIMADNRIGGLPVLHEGRLVGIITETDLFKIFLELMGAREMGVRVTAVIPDAIGTLAALTGAIASAGGDFVAFGQFAGDESDTRLLTFKVKCLEPDKVKEIITPLVRSIVDVRTSP